MSYLLLQNGSDKLLLQAGAGDLLLQASSAVSTCLLRRRRGKGEMVIPPGATSVSVDVQFLDDTGAAVTGKVAADFPACKWSGGSNTADTTITLSDLAAITTAHPNDNTAGGVKEREGGWYRLDIPNNAVSSAGRKTLTFAETTNKRIIAPFMDVQYVQNDNRQWLGGTIPAVNVTGVPLVDAKYLLGTIFSTPTVAGIPNVNAKTWNDLATVALPLIPTVAGRTLDCSAGGEAGVDWANVGSPTTTLNLSGTTIGVLSALAADSVNASALATDAVNEIRNAITGYAGALNLDSGGNVKVSDGTGANQIDTSSGGIAHVILCDTLTTYTSNTPQSADNNTRLVDIQSRIPAALTSGGNIKAGVQGFLDSVFTEGATGRVAAAFKQFFNIASPAATMDHGILVDTTTTLTNTVTLANGAHGGSTATLELGSTTSTVPFYVHSTGGDAVKFATSGISGGYAFNVDGVYGMHLYGETYNGLLIGAASDQPVRIESALFSNASAVYLKGNGSGYDLDVSTKGIHGNLVGTVSTVTTNTDMITAAQVRAALGMASANLDTQLAALPTATAIRNAITGGSYALDTDANGRIRIVDGTGAGEIDTLSGTVLLRSATQATIDAIPTASANATAVLAATITELGSIPGASPSLANALALMYMATRNRLDITASAKKVYNNAGTLLGTKVLSDDGSTYTEALLA